MRGRPEMIVRTSSGGLAAAPTDDATIANTIPVILHLLDQMQGFGGTFKN